MTHCNLFELTLQITLTISIRYGYVANTKVKFVIVVEAANTALRDGDIRTVRTVFMADTL